MRPRQLKKQSSKQEKNRACLGLKRGQTAGNAVNTKQNIGAAAIRADRRLTRKKNQQAKKITGGTINIEREEA